MTQVLSSQHYDWNRSIVRGLATSSRHEQIFAIITRKLSNLYESRILSIVSLQQVIFLMFFTYNLLYKTCFFLSFLFFFFFLIGKIYNMVAEKRAYLIEIGNYSTTIVKLLIMCFIKGQKNLALWIMIVDSYLACIISWTL